MSQKRTFRLVHAQARNGAMRAIAEAPEGYIVTIKPPTRSLDANAKFHAICSDLAKSRLMFAGKKRSASEWKVLLVSGHAAATKEGSEMVPGIEGEFVNLRESTALMSIRRSSSLIEYAIAYAVENCIVLGDHRQNDEVTA